MNFSFSQIPRTNTKSGIQEFFRDKKYSKYINLNLRKISIHCQISLIVVACQIGSIDVASDAIISR